MLDSGNSPGFDHATATPARNTVFSGVRLNALIGSRWSANAYYHAAFGGGDFKSQMVSGGIRVSF